MCNGPYQILDRQHVRHLKMEKGHRGVQRLKAFHNKIVSMLGKMDKAGVWAHLDQLSGFKDFPAVNDKRRAVPVNRQIYRKAV